MNSPEYIDDYGTCNETYSTLRVYHDSLPPTDVTARIGIEPDEFQFKGKVKPGRKKAAPINGWFLCSEGKVSSFDSRRHIDWIVEQIYAKHAEFRQMAADGYQIDISSYWGSKSGHGGPILSPFQMGRLAELGIDVSWDVYFHDDDDEGVDL